MHKSISVACASVILAMAGPAQSQSSPVEGAGPAEFYFGVDTEIVGVVIESPMANYGVTTDLVPPPENHGVPEWDDYNALRAELSRAIAADIYGIEASVGSKFAFTNGAGCAYDEGSESIFRKDGKWIVTFDIEFACSNPSALKDVSINLFDMAGFSSGTVTVTNGDAEGTVEVDGANRKVDLH